MQCRGASEGPDPVGLLADPKKAVVIAEQRSDEESLFSASHTRTTPYIFSNSRKRFVCARLTGTSDCRLSAIFSM